MFLSVEDDDFELAVEKQIQIVMRSRGLPLNSITLEIIKKHAKEVAESIKMEARDKGFPESIKKLFASKRKNDLTRIAKNIVISMDDISHMILNCDLLGYKHSRKHISFYPEGTFPVPEEEEAFSQIELPGEITGDLARKYVNKINEIFEKRRCLSAHLFEKNEEWHIFYFDFNDIFTPKDENHFVGGQHVHYISFLWGKNIDKQTVWEKFKYRDIKINSVHIKYREQEDN